MIHVKRENAFNAPGPKLVVIIEGVAHSALIETLNLFSTERGARKNLKTRNETLEKLTKALNFKARFKDNASPREQQDDDQEEDERVASIEIAPSIVECSLSPRCFFFIN